MFVDRETHVITIDAKAWRLHPREELHGERMDHVRCELGIIGAHGEAVIELLALEANLLAAPTAAHRELGKAKTIVIAVRISE